MTETSSPSTASLRRKLQEIDERAGVLLEHGHERRDALVELHQRAQTAGDDAIERELLWETQLAYATIVPVAVLDETRPRFVGFAPDLQAEPALDYLVTRLDSPSLRVRAVTGDFLWEYGDRRRRSLLDLPAWLLELAEARAKAARAGVEFAWLHATDPVIRAGQIAAALKDGKAMRAVADRSLELLGELTLNDPRHAMDMVIALSVVAGSLSPAEVSSTDAKIIAIADDLLETPTSPTSRLGRAALQLRKRFLAATGATHEALREVDRAAARSLISEGDAHLANGNGLIASVSYRQAMDMLQRLPGEQALMAGLRKKAREANLAGLEEMKPITVSGKIPTAEVEAFIRSFTDVAFPEVLEHIALRTDLLIGVDLAQRELERAQELAPVASIFPHVEVTSSGRTIAPSRKEDADRQRVYRAVRFHLGFQNIWMADIFQRLRDEGGVTVEGVVDFLRKSGNFEDESLVLIQHGLQRAWEDDVVSGMHILIPQLEDTLRQLLRRSGVDPLATRTAIPGVSMEATLGPICARLEEAGLFDEHTQFLFQLVLADPLGENLRNDVGHGLIRAESCTWPRLARIIQLYLIVAVVKPALEAGED